MTTAGNYSDDDFWQKLKSFAIKAGKKVIEKALWLYYAAQRPETPAWAKAIIFGALAYFILPLDAIPDVIPVAGFSDDLGALAAAIGMVSMYITADIKERTAQKLQQWFA
ncbi:YkvA family protein [Janthinobacterium sp. B9-8]|uniref:YkvA family protein n=1 Tax=Janthinobacterium sp. B9-8 TaxID=1236179 RepID=UPI00061D0AAB|nr:YkvA family protein [Janthinobacterium sp. B9-8]AMC34289.1 hypothetical protein VN23_06590 [Janthinobacterium sp. B9-8]